MTPFRSLAPFLLLLSNQGSNIAMAEELRFALIPKMVNNGFFDLSRDGCQSRVSQVPEVAECIYIGPTMEGDPQSSFMDDVINGVHGKIRGISLAVTDAAEVKDAIARAVNASIPVVTFDSDAPESERTAYVGTNNVAFGKEMGDLLNELKPNGGSYGLITADAPNHKNKAAGIRCRLEQKECTDEDTSEATSWKEDSSSPKDWGGSVDNFYKAMDEFAADPDVDAILPTGAWGFLTEDMSLLTTVRDRYPNVTLIFSETFGIAIPLMNMGKVDGLVGQLPYNMGELSVNVLLDINQGKEVDEYVYSAVERLVPEPAGGELSTSKATEAPGGEGSTTTTTSTVAAAATTEAPGGGNENDEEARGGSSAGSYAFLGGAVYVIGSSLLAMIFV